MNGFLLSGGRSERFGSDRAQAVLDGRTLFARAAETLARAVGPHGDVHAVGPGQARRADVRLRWLEDAPDVPPGPLGGLITAVRAGGGLVLACDMPCVPASTLQVLPFLGGAERPAAPRVRGRILPLCAWWPAGSAPALAAAMRQDAGSLSAAFERAGGVGISLQELGVRPEDEWLFTRVRTPYDLTELEGLVQARGGLWS